MAYPTSHLEEVLAVLVDSVERALVADAFDPETGIRVGATLASLGFVADSVPGLTIRVLHEEMVAEGARNDRGIRMALLATAIGQGHCGLVGGGHVLPWAENNPPPRSIEEAEEAYDAGLFQSAFDNVAVAIAIVDLEGRLLEVNRCLAESAGRPISDIRGMSIFDFAHPEEAAAIRRLIFDELIDAGAGTVRTESRMVSTDGRARWVAFSITYVRRTGGRADYLLAVGEDITARHRLQEELHWQSRHDPLTRLPNRRCLLERIEELCVDAAVSDRVGLCFVDIDGFKEINDRYGHGVGDKVLSVVARRLREHSDSPGHLTARIGGDEFVVLVAPPVDDVEIAVVADGVLDALSAPLSVAHREIRISASMGVVVAEICGARPETLLDAADRELYRAKKAGKDRWAMCVLDARALAVADSLADSES
ncbi:sensor domain-containing diguanylate cyclase [Nocardia sp. NPDC005366]|uniref:sensor domain-containing diguanylate cyclase n=1 Tax=Nocardia sp. NPDC005366 TaxID=3156878 RepID=UPI0033A0A6BA